MATEKETVTMRTPFLPNQISKLPKPTKQQTDDVKADYTKGIRCAVCGGWHHPRVVHLDYVGHAALTDRLLDVDPSWTWEPLSFDANGLPMLDKDGGLWIRLTVCGATRLGYGDAQGKQGGDAMKERIGDALRNAAMRFGAALDLWHKGDLHIDEERKPKELSDYTDAQLNENIAAWQAAINAGKSSPGKILAMIGTKYKLSEVQADAIRAIYPVKKEAPAIDAEFVEAMEKGEQQ